MVKPTVARVCEMSSRYLVPDFFEQGSIVPPVRPNWLFEEQSMKYDDELFLLLLTVFVVLGVGLLLALLF